MDHDHGANSEILERTESVPERLAEAPLAKRSTRLLIAGLVGVAALGARGAHLSGLCMSTTLLD